jgi:acyl-homoserine lactone acylase PvdQ
MDLKANTSKIPFMQIIKGILPIGMGTYSLRDKNLNWSKVVDGTTSATQWKGLHEVSETVHSYNPSNGWLQNCNSTPYSAAGAESPKEEDYLPYMAPDGESLESKCSSFIEQRRNIL